ncbi:MAG: spore germination protein [Clostridia bacterium]|nr:spore germination protein [Clostridia bacterium]
MKIIFPFIYEPQKNTDFVLGENGADRENTDYQHNEGGSVLSGYYSVDLSTLKKQFGMGESSDVKLREFTVNVAGKSVDACVFFIDGLTDKDLLNDFILEPLMIQSRKIEIKNANEIPDILLPQGECSLEDKIDALAFALNYGSAIVIVNGMDKAASIDIKGWDSKPIGEPQNEKVIRGPNDAFNEQLRSNTALVRRLIRNKSLVVEEVAVGKVSQTPCAIIYMKNIADDKLVEEVKRRVESLNIDYIMTSAEMEMYIEEKTFSSIPQVLSTERPDRTVRSVLDGKVAIIVDGSPYALLMPTTFYELNESTEDYYLRVPYANLMRIVRAFAFFVSLLLPGLYIAVMNFHDELIPTNLLIAIIAAKEAVPFPTFIELIFMEFALEIIREAGVRVPNPAGGALSIVGALILGQAAVDANIVSPVVIIVVSLAAIGSFATPNYYLGLSARVMKFVYIILGGICGLLGICTGLFIHALIWVHTNSMGVPMFSPRAPKMRGNGIFGIFIEPIWKREYRSDYQNPKRKRKEAKISRGWKKSGR